MKAWFFSLPTEARSLVAIMGAAICLVLILCVVQIAGTLVTSATSVSRQQPIISRLLGYEVAADSLKEAARLAEAQAGEVIFLGEAEASQSGAALQQILREFAQEAGLVVSGSQLAVYDLEQPEDEEPLLETFVAMTVSLSMEGPPMALDAFLESIRLHEPRITATSLDIQRPRQRRGMSGDNKRDPQQLMISLSVTGLWGETP